jgi:lipoprotein-anchoring transpeptidase ErfK/SrfK
VFAAVLACVVPVGAAFGAQTLTDGADVFGSSNNAEGVTGEQTSDLNTQGVTSSSAEAVALLDESSAIIEDGYYEILPAINQAYAVDIAGESSANFANAQLYTRSKNFAQTFKFTYEGGYYVIETLAGSSALEVMYANPEPGTNVHQYVKNGSDAQRWALTQNANGTYTFINKATGLALDVNGAQAYNGANIQGYTPNGTDAQSFALVKRDNLLDELFVNIASVLNTNEVLEVAGADKSEGANVQLYSKNDSQAQKWKLSLVSGRTNTYTIRSVVSGKYLSLDDTGNICVRSQMTDGNQYWIPTLAQGNIVFQNAMYETKSIDIDGAIAQNYRNAQGYATNYSGAQQFVVTQTQIIKDGMYIIRSAQNSDQVISVANSSKSNSANIETDEYAKTASQKWYIANNWDGTYTITNVSSGKSLDVANGDSAAGANVQQYDKNGSLAQRWHIEDNADGTFYFTPDLNQQNALTITEWAYSGANISMQESHGWINQTFTFEETSNVFYTGTQLDMYNKASGYSSTTGYLILVDCSANRVGIFNGSQGNWSYTAFMTCTSGAASTPTKKGVFTVASRGLSFGSGYTCWYWTQFSGNYLFHSVLYNSGSMSSIQDGRLGINASHGCVRLSLSDAKWIYDNIPSGTTVVVY